MPELKLEFHINLTGNYSDPIAETGPLFHRWLPDGKMDAIALTMPDEQEQIRVWFERRMVVNQGLLRWKSDGSAFDPNIMKRQRKLDGGLLFGSMDAVVSSAELAAIEKRRIKLDEKFGEYDPASQEYIEAGKRVAGKIGQRAGKFVSRLRTQYGQYWLKDMHPWDSRSMSLGTYCSSVLNLRWWSQTDASWCRFLPTKLAIVFVVPRMPGRGFAEYLSEEDWRKLQAHQCQSEVDLGVQMLGTATEALDTGNWPYAFVTVSTALEFALAARVQRGKSDSRIKRALNRFDDHETLPARVAVILLTCGVQTDAVSAVLSAIETRNKIAHEGYRPNEREADELRAVMQTIGFLMDLDELKIPILTNGNGLAAATDA